MNEHFTEKMNLLGGQGVPFLFIIDYNKEYGFVEPLSGLDNETILFDIAGTACSPMKRKPMSKTVGVKKTPVSYETYLRSFKDVYRALEDGESYLLNLTQPTVIDCAGTLLDIFHATDAPFKLYYKNEFVVFSPERFVEIENGVITTCPMKGTADASRPDALEALMNDDKELAEHITVVDLLRNDLNMVAYNVRVENFRYAREIDTGKGKIISTSSDIRGDLPEDYRANLGTIIAKLLPAGSVTGAPKKRTLEIIRDAEGYERGFYTGVFGVFDGVRLDSAVMIRFIEKQGDKLVYKSGGGITVYSNPESEYKEMIDKVYVPFSRIHKTD